MIALCAELRVTRGAFDVDVALETGPGITVVSGASGAGKSTLLLALLGALRPESGRIVLDGRTLFDSASGIDVPVHRRRVGMVFQDAPLFPHLDVAGNVVFALRGADRRARATAALERVGAGELAARRPAELSGGQRQRVALARALATEPRALLLDEPFSALDPAARETLGTMLVRLQRDSGIPFVHVTHDFGEALRVGARLLLMDSGRVVQSGLPADVLARPAGLVAARAVGTENRYAATVIEHAETLGCSLVDLGGTRVWTALLPLADGARVVLGLRAEDVLLSLARIEGTSARNVIQGTVAALEPRGAGVEVRVDTPVPVRALITPASVDELGLAPGRPVWLLIKAAAFHRLV